MFLKVEYMLQYLNSKQRKTHFCSTCSYSLRAKETICWTKRERKRKCESQSNGLWGGISYSSFNVSVELCHCGSPEFIKQSSSRIHEGDSCAPSSSRHSKDIHNSRGYKELSSTSLLVFPKTSAEFGLLGSVRTERKRLALHVLNKIFVELGSQYCKKTFITRTHTIFISDLPLQFSVKMMYFLIKMQI